MKIDEKLMSQLSETDRKLLERRMMLEPYQGTCVFCGEWAGGKNLICTLCLKSRIKTTADKVETYDGIRHLLDTGDVVLFRGRGLVSVAIRWWCSLLGRRWTWASHVGMVVKDQTRLMLFESTSIRGGVKGVRLACLSDALAEYKGEIKIRRLKVGNRIAFRATVSTFVRDMLDKPYERSLLELMRSAWTFTRNKEATPGSVFCSELVANVFQRGNLIPREPTANNYTPDDFRLGGQIDNRLRFSVDPACLSEEITIQRKEKQ